MRLAILIRASPAHPILLRLHIIYPVTEEFISRCHGLVLQPLGYVLGKCLLSDTWGRHRNVLLGGFVEHFVGKAPFVCAFYEAWFALWNAFGWYVGILASHFPIGESRSELPGYSPIGCTTMGQSLNFST